MFLQILQYIALAGTILTGLASLIWPLKVQDFTGLKADGGRGITEIRTILGALFVGLGAAPLILNDRAAFITLGITYLSMAVVRTLSMFVDDSKTSSNIISIFAEFAFGIILVL